jgi:hypothetical protein
VSAFFLAASYVRYNEVGQNYCRDGRHDDRVAGEPTEGGHDGNCDQRTDDFERVPDSKGEDATKDRTILTKLFIVVSDETNTSKL